MAQGSRLAGAPPRSAGFPPVLDALNDAVLASGPDGCIHYANAAAERLLGWRADELVGKPLTAIMPPRLRAVHLAGFRRFMTTHRSKIIGRPVRVPALHRDGGEIEVELTLSELPSRPGETRVIAVLRDLRDRIELERKIATQRKILAQYAAVAVLADAVTAAEAMPQILEATARALEWDLGIYWAVDPRSHRLGLSATWSSRPGALDTFVEACRPLTFGPGEGLPGAVLSSGAAVWSPDVRTDPRYVRAPLASEHGLRGALLFPVYCSHRTYGVLEYLSTRAEGLDEELRQTMKALGFQIGQFLERLRNEDELRRAWAQAEAERQNLRKLFEDAPAAISILRGPELRFELSNASNQKLAGGRELIGKTVHEALPELEADGIIAAVRRVYETGEPFVAREYPLTRHDGTGRTSGPLFMNGVSQPLRGASGAIEGVMMFAHDVTDLVTSRERVKEAEERLRLAVEAAEVGTWDYAPKTGVLRADAKYRRLYGLGPDAELTIDVMRSAIHPDDRASVAEALRRTFDARSGGEYTIEYRTRGVEDGLERWVSMRGRMMFDERQRPERFVGTGVDVTREKQAVDRLLFLGEASRILSSSLDYRVTLADLARLAVPRLADWCVVEIATDDGQPELGVVHHVDPAKLELAQQLVRRYPGLTTVSPIATVFATGQPSLIREVTDDLLSQIARDDVHLRMMRELGLRSALLLPVKGRERSLAVLGLFQAESGRRYSPEDLAFGEEVARRAAIAIENARLYDEATKAVGVRDQFLSIASHELRTPLTSLTLHLSALMRVVEAGRIGTVPLEKLSNRLALMDQQSARLAALVDELLDVSRISSGRLEIKRERMDLVELVRVVAASLDAAARRAGASISIDAPGPVVGEWDRNRLDQVVTNLLANAVKYAPGGPIEIEVGQREGTAFVTVRDRGPGIAEADQKRIFHQFERAAPPALGGLGLGLWIAGRIVEAHEGRIAVASRPGEGATFSVLLPLGAAP